MIDQCGFCGATEGLSRYGHLFYCRDHDDFYDTSKGEFPHG